MTHTPYNTKRQRGFTLIEMLVVLGIIGIMTVVVLANNQRFNSQIAITNLAYDISLSIRRAQSFGINVRAFQGSFERAFGTHFSLSDDTRYLLFADANDDEFYSGAGELVEQFTLTGGNRLSDLCVTDGVNERCSGSGLSWVDISFKRPDPRARIHSNIGIAHDSVSITVLSPTGILRTLSVNAAGQIVVERP